MTVFVSKMTACVHNMTVIVPNMTLLIPHIRKSYISKVKCCPATPLPLLLPRYAQAIPPPLDFETGWTGELWSKYQFFGIFLMLTVLWNYHKIKKINLNSGFSQNISTAPPPKHHTPQKNSTFGS